MIHHLFWLELFKLRKRLATWTCYLIFLALTLLVFGPYFYGVPGPAGPYRGIPAAWPTVLAAAAPIASLIGAVLTGLAVSSEFEWRTSRQNVIDGLSRDRWLLGKALLLPTITATLYGTQIALGTALARIDTHTAHPPLAYPAYTYLTAGFGVWLGLCIHAVVAFLIALWVRSSGPAIGLIFICQIFDNVAARVLQGLHLERIAAWLPFQIHGALLSFSQYLPDSSSAHSHPWSTGSLMLAGIGWMAALAAASGWIYLRRDL